MGFLFEACPSKMGFYSLKSLNAEFFTGENLNISSGENST